MRRSQITFVAIIAVIVAVAALYFATRKPAASPAATASPSPSATAANPSVSASPAAAASSTPQSNAVVLEYTDSGFSPASVTVTAGQQLTVKNTSGKAIQVDSNPHPVHTDDPELNIGPIAAGASATVTLNKTGTFGIHNHLDPSVQASVTIK